MIDEKVNDFDRDGRIKKEIAAAQKTLNEFRNKYPFKADPTSIDGITADDIYRPGEWYFFYYVEFALKPLGRISLGSAKAYENARKQLDELKSLLHIAVSDEKTLAEKVDAPWEAIPGMGGDKLIAKKIISCYDDEVLPIFKTVDLEHFFAQVVGKLSLPAGYSGMSTGERFQFLTQALIDAKNDHAKTRSWSNPYFVRFLYQTYPPYRALERPVTVAEPLSRWGLLFSPTSHDEVMFLFSKLHEKVGFPYILKIQTTYPDVVALDADRTPRRIEIETWASQFDHDPKECDFVVCWENDLESIPESWPQLIQLKDYL